MAKQIECTFSLLDTKRKYTGIHRKYVISNAREICYSPATREKISKREAFGFYGHGRRVLCGRPNLEIQEVDVITLPDGKQAMVSNIPSNITVSFDIDETGTVRHTQEILDTETGHIVEGLHGSRVGGFSWACPGKDGGTRNATLLTGFSGFDYVLTPGFSDNRGYVLESTHRDLVLESVAAVVGDDERAEQLVAGWRYAGGNRQSDLEDALFESASAFSELHGQVDALNEKIRSLEKLNAGVMRATQDARDKFSGVLESIAAELPFYISQATMDRLLDGDFERARIIFESARRTDFEQYPLNVNSVGYDAPRLPASKPSNTAAEFGTADYGFGLDV